MNNKYKHILILKIIFFFISLGFSCAIVAQSLHMPAEIEELMKTSSITYKVDLVSKTLDLEEENYPLVEKGWYAIANEEGIQLQKLIIQTKEETKKYRKKGEDYLKKQKYSKAIKFFKKALDLNPANNEILKALGKSYLGEDKDQLAIECFQKVIAQNAVDFDAHLYLAQTFELKNQVDSAIQHISWAHLYNRNDPKIIEELKRIYEKRGLEYDLWTLQPIYKIEKTAPAVVEIQYQENPWRAYASCKAVWEYEADYREEMNQMSAASTEVIQEKECLFNALIEYERLDQGKEKYPDLASLSLALINKNVNEYVLYEILSRKDPLLLYGLTKERQEKLMNYLMTTRVGKSVAKEKKAGT